MKIYSSRFHSLIILSSKQCCDAFIQSIIDAHKIIKISLYSFDIKYSILVACCLIILSKQTEISKLIQFFIKSKIFDQHYTIFSKGGLNTTFSIIRISIFYIILSIDYSFFYTFVHCATLHTLLLDEHFMRFSYNYGNMFFALTLILISLLKSINVLKNQSSSLQLSHLIKKQKKKLFCRLSYHFLMSVILLSLSSLTAISVIYYQTYSFIKPRQKLQPVFLLCFFFLTFCLND